MARGRQMGRLKLSPPSEATRQKYLREWSAKALYERNRDFPQLSAATLFGAEAPLEVEIGPGTGEYLCALAAAHPRRVFLGIEASRKAIYLAVQLAEDKGLENILFVRANIKLLYGLIPAGAWQRVYLHFPDPVHKPKDEKYRVFDANFLDVMARCLRAGGEISVVSDKADFFNEMLELAEGDSRFEKTHAERYLEGFDPPVKSRFQQAWERKGLVPRRFVVRKIGA